ncbi:MAG: branched-chain amino acid ABC transporter permease, partial [Helicobacter sp.]|nr:branched-chain amino acid ABC transporter permease [Helicobacter sp.]
MPAKAAGIVILSIACFFFVEILKLESSTLLLCCPLVATLTLFARDKSPSQKAPRGEQINSRFQNTNSFSLLQSKIGYNTTTEGILNAKLNQSSPRVVAFHLCLYAALALCVWGCSLFLGEYGQFVANQICIYAALAVSYNLINGVTGQLSLGANGFVAIGAYTSAILLLSEESKLDMFALGVSDLVLWLSDSAFLPALAASGFFCALLALLLSIPTFRVRGDYLAIVTLGFGFIIKIVIEQERTLTNGAIGLDDIPRYTNLYWSAFFALMTCIFVLQIVYSKYGRAMKAVRDDEDAAIAMGIDAFKVKTIAFCCSAFVQGVGGGLLAALLGSIVAKDYGFEFTFKLLIIIVLGGLGSTSGAVIGAVLVIGGGEWLRFLDDDLSFIGINGNYPGLRMVVFSLLLLFVMLFIREG